MLSAEPVQRGDRPRDGGTAGIEGAIEIQQVPQWPAQRRLPLYSEA
jgi:hypothetical protein